MSVSLESLFENPRFNPLLNSLVDGKSVSLKGLTGSSKALFLVEVCQRMSAPLLVVVPDREGAEALTDELEDLLEEKEVSFLPESEGSTDAFVQLNPRKMGQRMEVMRDLLFGKLDVVVTWAEACAQKLPTPESILNAKIELALGKTLNLMHCVEQLVSFGYNREIVVERPGEISLRGGILDIFPFSGEAPVRVEFFGNTIESMRTFDVATQRSTDKANPLILVPSACSWQTAESSIFDYFKKAPISFLDDEALVFSKVALVSGKSPDTIFSEDDFRKIFVNRQMIRHFSLSGGPDVFDVGAKGVVRPGKHPSDILKQFQALINDGYEVFLVCQNELHLNRLRDFLSLADHNIRLHIQTVLIKKGFLIPNEKIAVYTEADLFGRPFKIRQRKSLQEGVPIRELSALQKGDIVVHIDYGIGRYAGLEKIKVQDSERECLTLVYQDNDKIYVPVDRMERVQKYSGRDGASPQLTKLGTQKWEAIKQRTKKAILDIAKDLVALYSARQALPGFAFSQDTTWQKEMETSFLYEDTPDQAKAVEEVKFDMESAKPMDRLICGDVGFGKTEVAVRAAFKCVCDGKQVAVLVPTTILAQQHYKTFSERLDRFPVRVAVLSRFKTKREQQSIVDDLRKGKVDVIIGTHRLLSGDVVFKDIGLLIIDEEQRFGVRHKEKIKSYRQTIDVLTLTATPIPRTLHLSMMGIRDMSLINTPPKDRHPIITEVAPFDEIIIIEAIRREIGRGGQVFFVHNRVKSIDAVENMIRRLVPEARLAVAHGQMHEHDLEKVMLDFAEKKYDCLIATMIIESGLDMPNVNTLIIHRADRFGLAQLYQLRGRVGRSERRAYAYLLTPPFGFLSQDALKRLRTIEEFTELGSGYQIALRDLEIRGAGNLLGMQQSGSIDAVGFDLYQQLVQEAILELKQEVMEEKQEKPLTVDCVVDVEDDIYFPEEYVADESLRVNLYRRLSTLQTIDEIGAFVEEMLDRFGPLPQQGEKLLKVAEVRILGQKNGFQRIVVGSNDVRLFFDEQWIQKFPSPELFSQHLRFITDSSPVPIKFLQSKAFGFKFQPADTDSLSFTKNLLQSWQ